MLTIFNLTLSVVLSAAALFIFLRQGKAMDEAYAVCTVKKDEN